MQYRDAFSRPVNQVNSDALIEPFFNDLLVLGD